MKALSTILFLVSLVPARMTVVRPEPVVNPLTQREYVLKVVDDATLRRIAFCESSYRQFGSSGKILRGEQSPQDVGLFQIRETLHSEEATRLGYDLETLEGNLAFARYLLERDGLRPWASSKVCIAEFWRE